MIKCPAPGKTKFIKFPPSRAEKDVKCLGYTRGRGGCLSINLTGTLYIGGTFVIICSTFAIICGAFIIMCGSFVIICRAYIFICSAFIVVCGGFEVIFRYEVKIPRGLGKSL